MGLEWSLNGVIVKNPIPPYYGTNFRLSYKSHIIGDIVVKQKTPVILDMEVDNLN
jgi:hypothetical protein